MNPTSPAQVSPTIPEKGVLKAIDDIFHRQGPLTATDLRTLVNISQAVSDMHSALDMLSMLSTEEVEDLENHGAQDPSKATRVVQARHALARFSDLTITRVEPESIDVETLAEVVDESDNVDSPKP